jgi:L-iditol 2-dehydrogenase
MSLEERAMCEPLSVGVYACRGAEIGPEKNVLILGAGPIGLVSLLAARAHWVHLELW